MQYNFFMEPGRLKGIIAFVQAAEQLKDTLRSGRTRQGRAESTAEHTWRLCLLVTLFDRELAGIDRHKLLKLCLVHDLGEAISGDVPATEQATDPARMERERKDLLSLASDLPTDLRDDLLTLWDEYAVGETPEAVLAKGFDKIETMLQHTIGRNDVDFDYAFNLSYGTRWTGRHPLLQQVRELVDEATRARMEGGRA